MLDYVTFKGLTRASTWAQVARSLRQGTNFMKDGRRLEFVDTNILIYAHDISAGLKHVQAVSLYRELWESRSGCLSVQVLQEFYVNITRKVAKPLASEVASQIIAELGVWEVHRPGTDEVLDAIAIHDRYQISFWDAMIVVSASHMGCETLWSEDLNPGQVYDRVVVANPFT